ncbi:MAG: TolC family protein [Bryobacterales bacterium]|nr:TolC family protein [Bryobacterales bacterium]
MNFYKLRLRHFPHYAVVRTALCLLSCATSPVPAAVITLEQALALAEENHPRLKAGSARMDAAAAGITTAKARPNPEALAQGGGQTYRVPGNVSGFVQSYSISQPLELGQLRPARIGLAERTREVSAQELAAIRLSVLAAVRRAFFQALRFQGEIEILRENLRTVEDFRERIKVRVDVGEAGRLELYRADAELATARAAVLSAQLRSVAALSQLRGAVAAPLGDPITLAGSLDPDAQLPPLEQLRQEVVDRHPDLARAKSEIRRSEARLSYETAQRRPQPSIVAGFDRPPDVPIYRAGISLPLPFWNRREGPIAEAVAETRVAAAEAEVRRNELLSAMEGAYGRYQLATQQLMTYQEGVLRAGEEGLRAAEAAYRLGERGILDVLDAQRVLRTVRLELHHAQFDRQAALIDLDEARATSLR